jgi:hypothetical protein
MAGPPVRSWRPCRRARPAISQHASNVGLTAAMRSANFSPIRFPVLGSLGSAISERRGQHHAPDRDPSPEMDRHDPAAPRNSSGTPSIEPSDGARPARHGVRPARPGGVVGSSMSSVASDRLSPWRTWPSVARDRDPARPGRDRAGPRRGRGGRGLPGASMLDDGVEISYNNLSAARTTLLRRFVAAHMRGDLPSKECAETPENLGAANRTPHR